MYIKMDKNLIFKNFNIMKKDFFVYAILVVLVVSSIVSVPQKTNNIPILTKEVILPIDTVRLFFSTDLLVCMSYKGQQYTWYKDLQKIKVCREIRIPVKPAGSSQFKILDRPGCTCREEIFKNIPPEVQNYLRPQKI